MDKTDLPHSAATATDWLDHYLATAWADRLQWIRTPPTQILLITRHTGTARCQALQQLWPQAQITHWQGPLHHFSAAQVLHTPIDGGTHRKYEGLCVDGCGIPAATWAAIWPELFQCAQPGAWLGVHAWEQGSFVEAHHTWHQIAPWEHLASPFPDLHTWGDSFAATGWHDPVIDCETLTFTYPTLDHLVQELRAWGGTYRAPHHRTPFLTPRRWQAWQAHYPHTPEGYPMSVTWMYALVWRASTAMTPHAAYIPLEQIGRGNPFVTDHPEQT